MFEIVREEVEWAGRLLTLETGRLARQADGAVLATYGDTVVFATVVSGMDPKEGIDFLPLTVNYQEKAFAAGRIPGGYFKREGRPTERETLVSRLIDRPIRPLIVGGYCCETQVIVSVLSHDLENDPDVLALVAASAALTLSGVPFQGPLGAARVGLIDGALVVNPTLDVMERSTLDLIVSGTRDAVLMVESEAKELSESLMLEAVMKGHEGFQPVIESIIALAEKAAKPPREFAPTDLSSLEKRIADAYTKDISDAYAVKEKRARTLALGALKKKIVAEVCDPETPLEKELAPAAYKKVQAKILRQNVLKTKRRIDGRALSDIRPIQAEVGVLPRSHGSALFTRGETQALVVTTLGTGEDEQMIDQLEGLRKEAFMLHYNFLPYCVGETGRIGSPGRREIGHGKLAWRSIRPVLPSREDFPYTIRIVSEITESNGSSSMATVCGASLSMMDAGVTLNAPIAGIAMGLILEGDEFVVLSDILGDEDYLGDMDFKVAGTQSGVTALQMDIKIAGVTREIMERALEQAKEGRFHILREMSQALPASRGQLGAYAPRIERISIPVAKIREVIGTGGKVIREIVEKTGAKVDVADDGAIKVSANSDEPIEAALKWIRSIVSEPEVGVIYDGTVVKISDFGAFVNFFGARDGLVHISQLADRRVNKTSDVVTEGQKVKVKLVGFDNRGKVRLSMKSVDQETGEDLDENNLDAAE